MYKSVHIARCTWVSLVPSRDEAERHSIHFAAHNSLVLWTVVPHITLADLAASSNSSHYLPP